MSEDVMENISADRLLRFAEKPEIEMMREMMSSFLVCFSSRCFCYMLFFSNSYSLQWIPDFKSLRNEPQWNHDEAKCMNEHE